MSHRKIAMRRREFMIGNRILIYGVLIFLILTSASVHAEQKHLKLLAVSETESGLQGITADLYLDVQPGTGRVFLETYPLSKLDTQISTRFANEIACNYIDVDCSTYDFFYTIKADTPIIGGPSAGAAISILTIAALKDLPVNESISVTGTINSGGVIGPVGGLKEKIDGAVGAGITKVIIPEGERFVEEAVPENVLIEIDNSIQINDSVTILANQSKRLDLAEYAKSKSMELEEASSLSQAVFIITGASIKPAPSELVIDNTYLDIMKGIEQDLCGRASALEVNVSTISSSDARIKEFLSSAKNLSAKASSSLEKNDYYSAASYCFGANVRFSMVQLGSQAGSMTANDINALIDSLSGEIAAARQNPGARQLNTLTDLQALIVVGDRIAESENFVSQAKVQLSNQSPDSIHNALFALSFAQERLFTVSLWSRFFGAETIVDGADARPARNGKFILDSNALKQSCAKKISEAEERSQYVSLLFPFFNRSTKQQIADAYLDYSRNDFGQCLHKASMAKAESNVVLSVLGVEEDQLPKVIDAKLAAIKQKISEEQTKGRFPIMGYSYYEYASSLRDSDRYSALLYSEYALELSSLDIYFKKESPVPRTSIQASQISWPLLITGFFLGLLVGLILWRKAPEDKSYLRKDIRKDLLYKSSLSRSDLSGRRKDLSRKK